MQFIFAKIEFISTPVNQDNNNNSPESERQIWVWPSLFRHLNQSQSRSPSCSPSWKRLVSSERLQVKALQSGNMKIIHFI